MDVFLIFLTVFLTLVCSLCTALLVPLRQRRLRVEPRFFKRVKVPFPASALFAGIGNKSDTGNVQNFGVIIPMFVLHIVGYVCSLLIWAIVPVLYYRAGIDTDILFIIPLAIAVLFVVAVVVTEYLCVSFSRKKLLEEQTSEEHTEEEKTEESSENQG